MKKIKMSRELLYCLAILIMALGVAMTAKASYGVSMVVAPAYILSLKFSFLSFGQAEYCVQLLLVIAMCIITRRFKTAYIFSFVTSFVYGIVLDGFGFLLNRLLLESGYARTAVCILGVLLTSLSVAMFFRTYISPCGYDQFVKVVSAHFKIKIDKFKIGYDLTSLAVSIALTLILFKKIEGIGAVTVICAFINGILISGFGRLIDRKVSFYNRFGFDKYF